MLSLGTQWTLFLLVLVTFTLRSKAQLNWRKIPTTGQEPSGRRDCAVGYDPTNEFLYVFGGRGNEGVTNDLYRLRLAESPARWEKLQNTTPDGTNGVPERRFSLIGGYYTKQEWFVISTGEHATKRFFNDIWAYNTTIGNWTQLPGDGSRPETRYGAAGGLHLQGDSLWVSHGFDTQRYSNTFRYEFARKRWVEEFSGTNPYNPTKPHARCLLGGSVLSSDELIFFGGCLSGGKTGGPCPGVDSWSKIQGQSWRRMDDCASPRKYSAMAEWPLKNRTALLFGGDEKDRSLIQTDKAREGEIAFVDLASGNWKRLLVNGTFPESRIGPALVATHNSVLLFGGQAPSGNMADVWELTGDPDMAPSAGSCGPKWFAWAHLHGMFMVFSWGFCLQAGAFIARYFRNHDPLWFKLHRALQMTGFILGLLGFIFVWPGTHAAPNFGHAVIGLLIFLFSIQQVINGVMRPHKSDPPPRKRVFWEHWHKIGGRILLLLALINITLGMFLIIAPTAVWAIWLVIFILIVITYVVFEIRLRLAEKNK